VEDLDRRSGRADRGGADLDEKDQIKAEAEISFEAKEEQIRLEEKQIRFEVDRLRRGVRVRGGADQAERGGGLEGAVAGS
jgi:hypothetical protein